MTSEPALLRELIGACIDGRTSDMFVQALADGDLDGLAVVGSLSARSPEDASTRFQGLVEHEGTRVAAVEIVLAIAERGDDVEDHFRESAFSLLGKAFGDLALGGIELQRVHALLEGGDLESGE